MTIELTTATDTPEHAELRSAVRKLCEQFGDAYWQQRDLNREYPEEFVDTLTKAGWLSALIPAEYGGLGLGITEAAIILEEVNRSGGMPRPATPRCTPWARYCGTAAKSRRAAICPK